MNMQYTGIIKIGEQDLELLFDTGSSIFWVFSNTCPTQSKKTSFDCQSSPNCLMTKELYKVEYGQGEIGGNKAFDQLQVSNFTVSNFQFLIVNSQTNLENLRADGICGLGLQDQYGFNSLINILYDQHQIDKRIFAFFLNSIPEHINNASVLFIGGYDTHYMSSEVKYVKLDKTDSWSVKLNNVQLNKKVLIKDVSALIDTGTSLIVVPTHQFTSILSILRDDYKQFCQYSQYQIKCSCPDGDFSHFPEFELNFEGDLSLQLHPSDYIQIDVSVCVLSFTKSSNSYWILGDTFIRKHVTVFDIDNKQIGFAKLAAFEKQSKQIQINDYLYIFKVVCACICIAIASIWIIRQVSCLGEASHEMNK
ncbi:unnamed protein product (macronuclear) [Paramecium tetraurelia]|uniref:Peptidase A1 domain-containing protein n=1 Tax=Paramecium tetraurelia TaxID=5888 RepID=A0C8R2_PARTE|nr:uncharacterized protein GSPATT00036314001 [Paramecium tetraurelia]CAK67179.1 unnamed protein product [Paramecium tetraurelia]|eukprot:XP_001434576.1 hypothetical protein (macronuclear) [Paramecium tetraurelia strain d4-2]